MPESRNGRTPLHGPWSVGRRGGKQVPPSDSSRTPPLAGRNQGEFAQDGSQPDLQLGPRKAERPADPGQRTQEARTVTVEPLASAMEDPGRIRLASQTAERHHSKNSNWVVDATAASMRGPIWTTRRSKWFRTLLLLLMLAMLVAVAVWSPARLQALAASAIELLLSTDIPTSRSAPGPAPLVGQLDVTSSPSGIELFVDGELRGRTPLQFVLNAGNHELTFVSPIGDVRRRVRVRPGHRTLFSETIFPSTLVISTNAETEVRIDGRVIGNVGDYSVQLPPGHYQIALKYVKTGARSTYQVEVFPGQITSFDAHSPG